MPQNTVNDFEKFTGKGSGTIDITGDPITDFEKFRAQGNPATEAASTAAHPLRPEQMGAAAPSPTMPMTPAQADMTRVNPVIGPHGEVTPGIRTSSDIDPRTKRPFPGAAKVMSREDEIRMIEQGVPYVAGAGLTALAGPEVGIPAATGLAALGGMAGRAGVMLADPNERPNTWQARSIDIGTHGAEVGAGELGGRLAFEGGGWAMRRYFPQVAEAIENGTNAFLRAVPSNNIRARENYSMAMGDLQQIAKDAITDKGRIFSKDTAGGFTGPEMRPTDLYKSIQSYLKNMYTEERAGQIAAGTKVNLQVALKGDQKVLGDAMRRVARIPDVEEGAHKIAARVAENPNAPISIADADILARSVNQMLRKFEAGSASMQSHDLATQASTAMLEHADHALSDAINGGLEGMGMPGLRGYERRYAALARIADGLEKVIPNAERARFGLGPLDLAHNPKGVVRSVVDAFANNPGRQLESTMEMLARAPEIPRPVGSAVQLPDRMAGQQIPLTGMPGPLGEDVGAAPKPVYKPGPTHAPGEAPPTPKGGQQINLGGVEAQPGVQPSVLAEPGTMGAVPYTPPPVHAPGEAAPTPAGGVQQPMTPIPTEMVPTQPGDQGALFATQQTAPPAGPKTSLPPPPFVLSGTETANEGIANLVKMREAAKDAGASPEILANMDKRIAEINRRVGEIGDLNKAPSGVERRAGTAAKAPDVSKGTVSIEDALAGKGVSSMGIVEIDTGLRTASGPVTITLPAGKVTRKSIAAAIAKKRVDFGASILGHSLPPPPTDVAF